MGSLIDLKKRVWKANMDLFKKKLVVHTFGNVSGIDRNEGVIAIKPSGVPYTELTAEKIVLVDLDNNIIEGKYKPSSDTRTHLVLYNAFSEIGGVAHTHSPYATAWAQSTWPVPCFGTTHADYGRGNIPCTEIMTDKQIHADYETETGNQIVKAVKNQTNYFVKMIHVAQHDHLHWVTQLRMPWNTQFFSKKFAKWPHLLK
ncbi:L-ribulose-5-phosphate 4-epimerase [soil metagenome]